MSDPLPPRHCTDPATHGPHTYADDGDMRDCPGTSLRDRIAEALYQWTLAAAGGRRLIPPDEAALRENSRARADAVMKVVGPEIAHLRTEAARSARQSVLLMRRELDALQADLANATHFLVGGYRVGCTRTGTWQVWGDPAHGGYTRLPEPEDHPDRAAALARARQLAGEGQ